MKLRVQTEEPTLFAIGEVFDAEIFPSAGRRPLLGDGKTSFSVTDEIANKTARKVLVGLARMILAFFDHEDQAAAKAGGPRP